MDLRAIDISTLTETSKANISKLTRNGVLVKNEKKRYDSENEINKKYLLSKGVKQSDIELFFQSNSKKEPDKPKKEKQVPEKETEIKENLLPEKVEKIEFYDEKKPQNENFNDDIFEDVSGLPSKMMGLTLMELVRNYGGPMQLEKWAAILQKIMTAQKAEVSIQRDRLTLIEKDFVLSQIFKFVDEFINQIFDLADSQNEIIFSLAKTGTDEAKMKIKKMRVDSYSKILKETKKIINTNLNKMKDKYVNENEIL